jgi:hypothetical protein
MSVTRDLFRLALAFTLLVAAALAVQEARAADASGGGPLAMVITYHTAPGNRVAFRQAMEAEVPQFERWRAQGVVDSAHVMFSRHADSVGWDAMALITFARYADLERWKEIERERPAGLSQKTLALTTAVETVPGDLVRTGGRAAEHGVYLVIPYEYLVPAGEYIEYLGNYVVPQMDGWMEEGVLAHYGVFMARYPAGRPWQSMLILEYKDDAALGARDATTAKVRGRLKDNPKWKAISDSKKNVRNEKSPVLADPLGGR